MSGASSTSSTRGKGPWEFECIDIFFRRPLGAASPRFQLSHAPKREFSPGAPKHAISASRRFFRERGFSADAGLRGDQVADRDFEPAHAPRDRGADLRVAEVKARKLQRRFRRAQVGFGFTPRVDAFVELALEAEVAQL